MSNIVRGMLALGFVALWGVAAGAEPWITFEGKEGAGKGKHVVFVTGDEEYRSEESMPQLAKILAERHSFRATVLFAINPQSGEIEPTVLDNIPGLELLRDADLMVLFTRFRELPDDQMKQIVDYTNAGKPIISLRTATHPFFYKKNPASPYAKYSWQNKAEPWQGGYGRQVLGETWISHWGHHQKESTRGLPAEGMANHPLLRGVGTIWGPSDVYEVTTLTGDAKPVVMGHVLKGMNPDDEPNTQKRPMPVAWLKTYQGESGKTSKIFATTMGHGGDLEDENFRRLLVNAVYWLLGMEVPEKANVEIVGKYEPTPIGFAGHKKGLKPADHALPAESK